MGSGEITLENGEVKQGQFYETIKLLNWGFDNFKRTVISEDSEVVAKVNVTLSTQTDQVMVRPSAPSPVPCPRM